MPLPRLIHPVPILIRLSDDDETFFDDDAREPVQKMARKPTVQLDGQVRWPRSVDPDPVNAGDVKDSRGYILFRQKDIDDAGVVLSKGDNIIKIGKLDSNEYINEFEPLGHYPDQGGHTLLKAYYAGRAPSRK